jgi:hypothetical protein
LHGGKPLIRDLLELVGQDPLYHPGDTRRAGHEPDAAFP